MAAGDKIILFGDGVIGASSGGSNITLTRGATVAQKIAAETNVVHRVYIGDPYESGDAAAYAQWDACYGDAAPTASPTPGANLLSLLVDIFGNHSYFVPNATTRRADGGDTYWTSGSPARNTRSHMTVDLTKNDPAAVYPALGTGLNSDSHKVANAQWSHLSWFDVGVWRFIHIDAGFYNTQNDPNFPTAGAYYDAVAALINAVEYRRCVVCVHFPRWTSGQSHTEASSLTMAPLWSLCGNKAIAYIGGHNHHYERQLARDATGTLVTDQRRGCISITTGNAGANLNAVLGGAYNLTPAVAFTNTTVYGYLRCTILSDTQIKFESISCGTDGLQAISVIDTVTLDAAPQFLRPSADVSAGGWTVPSAIGNLPTLTSTDIANGVSGTLTVPASASPITDKWLLLEIENSDTVQANPNPTIAAGGGTFGTLIRATAANDAWIYLYARPAATGDAGAAITWTVPVGESKGTIMVVSGTDGIDQHTGSTFVSVNQTERNTGALTPTDPNTLAIGYFAYDSSSATGNTWSIGSASIPAGWAEINDNETKPSTRSLVTLVQTNNITSPVSVNPGAVPDNTQESAQHLILMSPRPRSYNAEVVTDAPASYLKLNDVAGSTTAADSTVNNRTGTYVGLPTLESPGLLPGESETAVVLTGGDRIEWNTAVSQIQSAFTFEVWCQATAAGTIRTLMSLFTADGATAKMRLRCQQTAGKFSLLVGGVELAGPTITPGNVYHHVVTVDGANAVRWTQNGTVVGTHGTALPARATDDLLTLGMGWTSGPSPDADGWNQSVEKASIYTSVMTDARIGSHYSGGTATQPDTTLYTRLRDQSDGTYIQGTAA